MAEGARRCVGLGVHRFKEVLDSRTRPGKCRRSDLPNDEETRRPFFAQPTTDDRRQRAGAIIRLGEFVAAAARRCSACRLCGVLCWLM